MHFNGIFIFFIHSFFKNNPLIKKGVTTGLLGALTTFSTFQFELVTMSQNNSIALLFIYGLTSYIGGILFCWFGVKLGATYMIHILFIMVGGGIGAVIRAWLTDVFKSKITSPIPIATLIVNLVGSFLIGFVYGIAQDYQLFSLFL